MVIEGAIGLAAIKLAPVIVKVGFASYTVLLKAGAAAGSVVVEITPAATSSFWNLATTAIVFGASGKILADTFNGGMQIGGEALWDSAIKGRDEDQVKKVKHIQDRYAPKAPLIGFVLALYILSIGVKPVQAPEVTAQVDSVTASSVDMRSCEPIYENWV